MDNNDPNLEPDQNSPANDPPPVAPQPGAQIPAEQPVQPQQPTEPATQESVMPDPDMSKEIPRNEHHKNGAHSMIAIVIAVILVMGIVGVGFYLYDSTQDDNTINEVNTSSDNGRIRESNDEDGAAAVGSLDEATLTQEAEELDDLVDEIEAIEGINLDDLSDENL